jgi:hypothetical protein
MIFVEYPDKCIRCCSQCWQKNPAPLHFGNEAQLIKRTGYAGSKFHDGLKIVRVSASFK